MCYSLSLRLPLFFVWLICALQTATLRCLLIPGGSWWPHKVGERLGLHRFSTHRDEQSTLAAFKHHPLHVGPSELGIFQVSLPRYQLCCSRAAARLHKSQPGTRLSFSWLSQDRPICLLLLLCSLDAPLNVLFCLFFPLTEG